MIRIEYRDGLCCPVVICDECEGKITDHSAANVNWSEDGKTVLHVHKACDRGTLPWDDLSDHFHFLFRNIGLTLAAFRREGRRADELTAAFRSMGR